MFNSLKPPRGDDDPASHTQILRHTWMVLAPCERYVRSVRMLRRWQYFAWSRRPCGWCLDASLLGTSSTEPPSCSHGHGHAERALFRRAWATDTESLRPSFPPGRNTVVDTEAHISLRARKPPEFCLTALRPLRWTSSLNSEEHDRQNSRAQLSTTPAILEDE